MHDPVFYQAKSAVASLCLARNSDKNLRILGLFGKNDTSIQDADLELSVDSFKNANISYKEVVYPDAGHAFFAKERPMYNENAYNQALEEIKNFII
jgi:carboxymethylenebutenolidase